MTLNRVPEGFVNGLTELKADTVKQELYIDVISPPANTGLLPLTLTDATVDSTRLQAMFDYIKANEYTFQPNARQYVGYAYTLKFPKGVVTLGSTVTMKGQYLNIIGDGTIIKTTHTNDVFYASGLEARKLHVEGFIFTNNKTAINLNLDKIDTCMMSIERCWFFATTDVAVKVNGESTMLNFHKCHFYQCRFIYEGVNPDFTLFDNCWFSESPRLANYETSFTLKGRFTKFRECFFIPSGLSGTGEDTLTEVAWIDSYQSVEIESCRVSSESNSKTLINNRAAASIGSPYTPQTITIRKCLQLSHQWGECTVRLFTVPNKIDISENGFIRSADVAIKYSSSFDVNTWLTTNSTVVNNKVEIILDNNIGQANSNWTCPAELNKFLRFNHVDDGMIKKDTVITSVKEGTFSSATPYFDITTNLNINSASEFTSKIYMIKLEARPSAGSTNYKSTYLGLLSFTVGTYDGALKAKVFLSPLISNQGGNATDQGTAISISAIFVDSGVDTTPIVGGNTNKYAVRITWGSIISSTSGKYVFKEVMDGAFLF